MQFIREIPNETMESFMKRKKTQITKALIKESLLRQLSYSVKEVQLQYSQTNEVFSTNEACNSLIVVIEAIFLHGLKKGIFREALQNVASTEESKPEPSFFGVVSTYTHKDTVRRIKKLSQIKTDVGRCRVWLRIALNQTEITSYLQAMEKERRPIHNSYYNYAFLRDRETCDTACKLLEGIVGIPFDIPLNASILNTWNTESLLLSGTWFPAQKIQLSTAIDVAEGIEVGNDDDDASSIKTSSSITTLSTILALDEKQALKIILETPLKELEKNVNCFRSNAIKNHGDDQIVEEEEEEPMRPMEAARAGQTALGNSLSNAPGWSSGKLDDAPIREEAKVIKREDGKAAVKAEEPKTYRSLLESYGSSPRSEQHNFKSILEKMTPKPSEEFPDFEVCPEPSHTYEEQLFKIVREKGLKAQNYTCTNCQLSIGLNFDEARYCHFTCLYYCNKCHLNETSVIPSRLLYNWDHKKYPVCAKVHSYLSEITQEFLIDVKRVNPKLYLVVEEMKELRKIRFKLNLLRGYLSTCREPAIDELRKRLWPRDYLFENIHEYSLTDLSRVPGGILAAELNAAVSLARDHVLHCCLCSQKGFICEICRNPKVIYPFDCDSTYRCGKCYSVYHGGCLASSKNCPKCRRLKQRASVSKDDRDESE